MIESKFDRRGEPLALRPIPLNRAQENHPGSPLPQILARLGSPEFGGEGSQKLLFVARFSGIGRKATGGRGMPGRSRESRLTKSTSGGEPATVEPAD
jgi:hypothetical protein